MDTFYNGLYVQQVLSAFERWGPWYRWQQLLSAYGRWVHGTDGNSYFQPMDDGSVGPMDNECKLLWEWGIGTNRMKVKFKAARGRSTLAFAYGSAFFFFLFNFSLFSSCNNSADLAAMG
jgi:hypothetical protein